MLTHPIEPQPGGPLPPVVAPAHRHEAAAIHRILEARAPQTIATPLATITRNIHRYGVIRSRDDRILACAALMPKAPRRFELRSVAVAPGYEGQGLGQHVLLWAGDEARRRGLLLLCVTTHPKLFGRFGFKPIAMPAELQKAERETVVLDSPRQAMILEPTDAIRHFWSIA